MFFKNVYLLLLGVWFVLLGEEVCGAELEGENIETDVDKETKQPQDTSARPSRDVALRGVYEAIKTFKLEYERQHQVTDVICELDETTLVFEASYFTSEILKLKFSYKTKDGNEHRSSMMIKVPEMGVMYHHGKQMLFYDKEKFMYEKAFPLIYEKVPDGYEKLVPNFYGSTDSGVLVLENLMEQGFKGWPKGTLLDFVECDAIWKSLAQFHALSTTHLDQISAGVHSLTSKDFPNDEWSQVIVPSIAQKVRELVLPRISENITAKFDDVLKDPTLVAFAFAMNPNGGRNVLLHGDTHLSNILFRKDENGNGLRLKFIDFQISRLGSPILDLMRFTLLSVKAEVFGGHREELFVHYVHEFNRTLQQLGVNNENPYSVKELDTDFDKYKRLFFRSLCGDMPALWGGSTDANTLITLLESQKYLSTFEIWTKHLLS